MRNLKPLCAAIMLLIGAVSAKSQETAPLTEPNYKKVKLFSSLPENIKVNINNLKELLKLNNGEATASNLGDGSEFAFNGQVVSTASKYNNTIKSVVVRSSNFTGANLTFTQVTDEDGNIRFIGRIISFEHGDVFELKETNGQYEFVKKKFHDLVNE
jgi:hypothetical protein